MGESDPLYAMLQWLTERMMDVESEMKVGAAKGSIRIQVAQEAFVNAYFFLLQILL